MKRRTILVCAFALLAAGSALAFQNEPDGFRGIKFGQSMKSVKALPGMKGLVCGDEENKQIVCMKGKEDLNVGGVRAQSIAYVFYDRKFSAVMLNFDGLDRCMNMRQVAVLRYGAGEERANGALLFWNGTRTMIMTNATQHTYECAMTMWDLALKAAQEGAAEAAAQTGF